jgi:two-component system response regulator FixJ
MVHFVEDDVALHALVDDLMQSIGIGCKAWSSPEDMLANIRQYPVSLLLLDVRLRSMSGLQLLRTLRDSGIQAPVIFVSGTDELPVAIDAMRMGAKDFLTKPFSSQTLLDSVQRALKESRSDERQRAIQEDVRGRMAKLSQREHDVLVRLLAGKTNKVTAAELGLSDKTVEEYRAKVMSKLRADSVADLVKMAVIAGEADPYNFNERAV